MRRRHLIELHEQPWYPALWRQMFQEGLGRAVALVGSYQNVVEPFRRFLRRTRPRRILDLCSGSAAPLIELRRQIGERSPEMHDVRFVLSDLYPDVGRFERISRRHPGVFGYLAQPVNALKPPAKTPGVRTLISSLHHFRPEQVRAILQDAALHAEGIAILESTGRTWANMVHALPIPLAASFITSFTLRPFNPLHVIWGLLVPIVPLTALFDTWVSNLRTYTVDELREIVASIDAPNFEWEIGTAQVPRSPLQATYLFGWRKDRAHGPQSEPRV